MIYVCTNFRPLTENDRETLLSFLPTEEQKRISKLKYGFYESLTAYALLFRLTSGKELVRDSFGKPYFPDLKNISFSISHTDDGIAVAISDGPIGADIEKSDRSISQEALKRVCSPEEFLLHEEKSLPEKIMLWTLKEAYGKYKGKGLSYPLREVSFPSLCPVKCSDPYIFSESLEQDGFTVSYVSSSKEKFTFFSLEELLIFLQS